MNALPNLAGKAPADLVQTIGTGSYSASYINWSRTVQLLREHAPGWMPELVKNNDGGVLHRDPVGACLLIRFRHLDGTVTPDVPQAVMDPKNNAIPYDRITSRDVSDTHRRGVCMAAAFTFGLAYELWAKLPLESGYAGQDADDRPEPEPTIPAEELQARSTEYAEAIKQAETPKVLQAIAKELASSKLPPPMLKALRDLYSQRQRTLKEAA